MTFHKDVEPILQARCQRAIVRRKLRPWRLLTYQQARPWAKAIRAAVVSGKMPPWQADPHYGKFSNDLSLAPAEKQTLIAWVDGGALEGDPAEAPAPRTFTQGWRIPKPDVVFETPEDFPVPAQGTIDYQYITVPTHFTEDKWVEIAEVRPSNRSVVHHAIVMVDELDDGRGQEYLAGYAPGMMPQNWKPGQARLIRAGSSLVFQMHYTTNGKPGKDRTKIGLIFAKNPPAERIGSMEAMAPWMTLAPGEAGHSYFRRGYHARACAADGHAAAHASCAANLLRFERSIRAGNRKFCCRSRSSTSTISLITTWRRPNCCPEARGLSASAVYDNSAANPRNPDPTATVTWGPQTWDEMMIGWLDVGVPVGVGWSARGDLVPVQ